MQGRTGDWVAAGLFVALVVGMNGWPGDSRAPSQTVPLPAEPAIAGTIRAILDGGGPPVRRPGDLAVARGGLATLYSPATPLWSHAGAPTREAMAAVRLLQDAGAHGLVPEDYDAAWLREQLFSLSADPAPGTTTLAVFDVNLSIEMLESGTCAPPRSKPAGAATVDRST